MDRTTGKLVGILKSAGPDKVGEALAENSGELFSGDRPFSAYIRELLARHNLTQQQVIRVSGFSDRYGYRLLSEERHTKQRDYILRICLAAELTLDECQRLLKLYGMSPLYARIPRDAVLLSAISNGEHSIERVNALLEENGMPPLRCSEE